MTQIIYNRDPKTLPCGTPYYKIALDNSITFIACLVFSQLSFRIDFMIHFPDFFPSSKIYKSIDKLYYLNSF